MVNGCCRLALTIRCNNLTFLYSNAFNCNTFQVKLWPLAKTIEHYPATPHMQEKKYDSDTSSEDDESESDTSDDDSNASPAKSKFRNVAPCRLSGMIHA